MVLLFFEFGISAYISQTGGLGNVGAVSYYWTRAVILGNWRILRL
jgi:hypothetical protein